MTMTTIVRGDTIRFQSHPNSIFRRSSFVELLGAISASLFACGGCFGFLPMILAAVALIDSIRTGAGWYWCLIILGLPVAGPIAYFIVVRSPWLGSRGASFMSHSSARRLQARRHLKALQVQLGHWRGPGVLAEAGEELLVLGKTKEAEQHFREALDNGAAIEDVHFGLAQALQAQGRFADAVPYLETLVAAEPDSRLGEGPLALARCLDESGRREEAEPVLRRVLERRTIIEAQVRLARILLQKGDKPAAGPLLAEIAADAKTLPPYLKRRHRGWLRAARQLKPGTSLPRPRVDGAITARDRLQIAGVAAGALLVLAIAATYLISAGSGFSEGKEITRRYEEVQRLQDQIDTLDRTHGWPRGDDLALVDLTGADLDRYLRVRRGLEPALREAARQKAAIQRETEAAESSPGFGQALAGSSATARWIDSETAFLRSLAAELERETMGPRELGNLIALVEWRFLRRPDAMVYGLPEFQRGDWVSARQALSYPLPEGAGAEMERWLREQRKQRARLQAKTASLEKEANAAIALSPATQALLESRRAELAAFDPANLDRLLRGLDTSLGMESPWEEE
jgi:hypothetical protein